MTPSLSILLFCHCVYGVTSKKLLLNLRLQTFTTIFSSLSCTLDFYLKSRGKNKATNKVSRGDGIPVELFQILKDDTLKMLHLICQQIWKTQQWPPEWERSVFIPIPKKDNAKECSKYQTILFILHTGEVMLKILQARFWQYMNRELHDVQAAFRKGSGTRDQIANICLIIRKARVPEKHLLLLYWLCQSLWLCGWQQTVENS